MNQGEFAAKMGMKQNTWSNIERGTNPCSDRYINLICLTFKVRKEWLVSGVGDMFESQPENPATQPVDSKGKPLPPEMSELITIFQELVPLNQNAVLDFMKTALQSQRNTLKTIETETGKDAH